MAESDMSGQEPGTSDTTHQRDWEAQRERLSAYLDHQLPADERAALERHLPACARCTVELAELRRTVAVLRALPAPALPRSFALPESAAAAESMGASGRERPADGADRERTGAALLTPLPARQPRGTPPGGRPPRWSGIAQWAGGLAAVAGLVVLLGGALSGLPLGHPYAAGTTGSGAANLAPHAQTTEHALSPTPSASGTEDTANQALKPTPATTMPAATGSPERTPSAAYGPNNSNGATSPLPILPLAGGGLVLGGGLVFIAGSAAKRRRP
ncbi:MAG TPA: zf-HC2 domain-containing protein [Ktedonobacterales bacterium]